MMLNVNCCGSGAVDNTMLVHGDDNVHRPDAAALKVNVDGLK